MSHTPSPPRLPKKYQYDYCKRMSEELKRLLEIERAEAKRKFAKQDAEEKEPLSEPVR